MPRKCLSVSTVCGPSDVLTEERMRFFNQTVKAVTDAVIAMQGELADRHGTTEAVMSLRNKMSDFTVTVGERWASWGTGAI